MSKHPNVEVVDRMTEAVMSGDAAALEQVFTPDLTIHARGPLPNAGDHAGVEGFHKVIGTIMELTGGDVKLEQLMAAGDGPWAIEWERAVCTRNGETLELHDVFVYRLEENRIAEVWILCAERPEVATFWS
jgi:ketosteroid isomerase-like protein